MVKMKVGAITIGQSPRADEMCIRDRRSTVGGSRRLCRTGP